MQGEHSTSMASLYCCTKCLDKLSNHCVTPFLFGNVRCRVNTKLMAELRIGQTIYIDGRGEVGSGNAQIQGNKQTTIKAQVRYSF